MKIDKKFLDEAYTASLDFDFLKSKKKLKSKNYRLNKAKRKNRSIYESLSVTIPQYHTINTPKIPNQIPMDFDNLLNENSNDHDLMIQSNENIFFENEIDESQNHSPKSFAKSTSVFSKSFFKKNCLYPGTDVDLYDFYLSLHSLKSKHNLNTKAMDDILKLLNLILPKENKCPKTYSKIEKYLSNKESSQVFFCCVNCKSLSKENIGLESLNTKKNMCEICSNEISPFVTFNVKSQITRILENKNLFNQIINNNSLHSGSHSISDMTDGSIYKKMLVNSKTQAISLVLNTDGAPITNSKNYNIWPVLGTIVELDPQSRENFKNIIT